MLKARRTPGSPRLRRRGLSCTAFVVVILASAQLTSLDIDAGFGSPSVNDFTLILRGRAGPYKYWRTLTAGGAFREATAAFGRPTSRGRDTPESNVCTVRWEAVGVDVGFAWSPGPCTRANLKRASWAGMRLFGLRWRTGRGLRIGDPAARIKKLYPRARHVSRPPQPGEWWLVTRSRGEFGAEPLLVAEVGAGRVIALRVPPTTH